MGLFSDQLHALTRGLLSETQWAILTAAQLDPLDVAAVADFDDALAGPSMRRLNAGNDGPPTLGIAGYGKGSYEVADRELFRGLHYCGSYLNNSNVEALMRPLIVDGGVHIEALLKRMTGHATWHLARLARHPPVAVRFGVETAKGLRSYAAINNAAKHPYGLEVDGHMFSVRDGVLAYFAVRTLALRIYPEVRMVTDWQHLTSGRDNDSSE